MRSALGVSAFLCLVVTGPLSACSRPVFRYALEEWPPTNYTASIYHRGALSTGQSALVTRLSESSANLKVSLVDLANAPGVESARLWRQHGKGAALPAVLMPYPEPEENQPLAYRGPLDDRSVTALLESPTRTRLSQLLTSGASVVWILLESGDATADDAAEKLLARELASLEKSIELPEQPDAGTLKTSVPLKVSFPVVRLSRTTAEESVFVRLLLDSEEGLAKSKGPIVFPMFGRGRVLWGLEGESLTAGEVARAAKFLCAACSCHVKELNPGVDMLMAIDWDELLDSPAPPTVEKGTASAPTIPPGKVDPVAEKRERSQGWWLIGAAGVVVLLTGVWALFGRRVGGSRS